jgi:hypothetical protein
VSVKLAGVERMARVARGTKSEHLGIVLRTNGGTFRLRRRGGHAFGDPALRRLVGARLQGEGTLHGSTFIVDRVLAVDRRTAGRAPTRPRQRAAAPKRKPSARG